jgi:hypothetical protein
MVNSSIHPAQPSKWLRGRPANCNNDAESLAATEEEEYAADIQYKPYSKQHNRYAPRTVDVGMIAEYVIGRLPAQSANGRACGKARLLAFRTALDARAS